MSHSAEPASPVDATVDPQLQGDRLPLVCYRHPAWRPLIRPAPATRGWMDQTSESYAYRCLPLNIANAHGWEVLTATGFEATWDGGPQLDCLSIKPDSVSGKGLPVSIFGYGVLTFHIEALVRTPPGWNLFLSGTPNAPKDGIGPLTGIIETDWSPYSFTMNWKFTRPGTVRFEEGEPFAFFFPIERGAVNRFDPDMRLLEQDPDLADQFSRWSKSRDAFRREVAEREKHERLKPSEKWQKRYYRGVDMNEQAGTVDHEARLRLAPFPQIADQLAPAAPAEVAAPSEQPAEDAGSVINLAQREREMLSTISRDLLLGANDDVLVERLVATGSSPDVARRAVVEARANPLAQAGTELALKLRKREWMMKTELALKRRHGRMSEIERLSSISVERFYRDYVALNLPVVLSGLVSNWPAVRNWTVQSLAALIGDRDVELQADRNSSERFELYKDNHRRVMPFSEFMSIATDFRRPNEVYITAYNTARNREALAPLYADMNPTPAILDQAAGTSGAMLWIGGAGTFTPAHHDLTNNLLVQMVGRKVVKMIPPAEAWRMRNDIHVFSEYKDIDAVLADPAQAPALDGIVHFDVMIGPGDALFIPIGWWHQVRTLDFSLSATFTSTQERVDYHESYPFS